VTLFDRLKHLAEFVQPRAKGLLCLLAGQILACDQLFDPTGGFERKLVVYSILTTNGDMQFVRVCTTYDVPGFDPYENTVDPTVSDAAVTIMIEGRRYAVRDTILPRPMNTRYKTPILAYVAQPFPVTRGKTYQLEVVSPTLGTAFSSTTVPEQTYFDLHYEGTRLLERPPIVDLPIRVLGSFSKSARGYVLRFLLVYSVLKDSVWSKEEEEVPLSYILVKPVSGVEQIRYPEVKRIEGSSFDLPFMTDGYRWIIRKILARNLGQRVVFTQAKFQLTQLDENLYRYYMIVHAFQDRGSIRLDQPDYSNINGAFGVFGAYSVDSLLYALPPNFPYNR